MPDLPDELAALLHARAGAAPVPPAASDDLVHAVRRRQYLRAGTYVSGTALAVTTVVGVAAAVVPTVPRAAVQPAAPVPSASAEPESGCAYLRFEALPVGPGGDSTAQPEETFTMTLSGQPTTGETYEPEPTGSPETEPTEDETATAQPDPTPDPTPEPTGTPSRDYGFEARIEGVVPRFAQSTYDPAVGTTCVVVADQRGRAHEIELTDAAGRVVWKFDTEGRQAVVEHSKPLAAGRHTLLCRVHPTMRATVDVR